jgi:hypothetical protein
MRKFLGILLTLTLLLIPPAFGAVKAGTSCKQLGLKTTSGKVTFTCIKSGKKLVWDKGKATPSAPKASPTPLPSISPTPTPTPTPSPSITPADYYEKFGARGAIYKYLDLVTADIRAKTIETNSNLSTFVELPNEPFGQAALKRIRSAADRWRVLAPQFQNPTIVIANTDKYLKDFSDLNCSQLYQNTVWGGAAIGCIKFIGIYLPSTVDWHPASVKMSPAHEVFHNVQMSYSQGKNWNYLANWFMEGAATVMGTISATIDENSIHYDAQIGPDNYTRNDCLNTLNLWESNKNSVIQEIDHNLTNHCEYGLGRIMVEYLIYKSQNTSGLLTVFSDIANGISMNDSFKKNFGMNLSEYYAELRNYLTSTKW